jgi:hypothetical protein
MNGKRWPWEAVTLLPFIDSKKLIEASRTLVDESLLSDEERELNTFGNAHVFKRCPSEETINVEPLEQSKWKKIEKDANVAFLPILNPGVILPSPCFPTLNDAPVKRMNRRKININVFGLRSRYRTALLEIEDLPPLPPAHLIAKSFVGTTVYFRYPILQEGFVCAVSDSSTIYRGTSQPRKLTGEALEQRKQDLAKLHRVGESGAGMVGTGGVILPPTEITLRLRPLVGIETLPDGSQAKTYAKFEVEVRIMVYCSLNAANFVLIHVALLCVKVPLFAAIFSPTTMDPRLDGLPAKLEKNPYAYDTEEASLANINISKGLLPNNMPSGNGIDDNSGIYSNTIQPTKMSAGKERCVLN